MRVLRVVVLLAPAQDARALRDGLGEEGLEPRDWGVGDEGADVCADAQGLDAREEGGDECRVEGGGD